MSDMIDGKTPNEIRIEEMKERMDEIEKISPTMCTAKWLQSTINLHNGTTHSCHHPAVHSIKVEDIKNNPSGLHNTPTKKKFRQMMLDGERPDECQYCWNIEDLPGNHFSDRTYKSADVNWSTPFLPRVLEAQGDGDVNPSYLEIAFDSTCNFKCAYCSPDTSSKWMEEVVKHGAYPTSRNTHNLKWMKDVGRFPIHIKEENPYLDAFWEWWPKLYWDLNTFRITGGEPLLSKGTWKILDYVLAQPRKDFNLAINTNMNMPDKLVDRLIDYHKKLDGKIQSFEVFTSCEAVGPQAEYIRYGMNYQEFIDNCWKYLEETNGRLNIMITFNILSLPSFKDFLEEIYKMRTHFNETDADNRIPIMIAYLRWPPFMNMQLAPLEMREKYTKEIKDYVMAHTRNSKPGQPGRFYLEEVDQVERLCEYMLLDTLSDEERKRDIVDFGIFFEEYDKRRGTNFKETFPEFADFYDEALELKNG